MPPANLAHVKPRIPSGAGSCNEPMPPNLKRARDSAVGERIGVGRGSPSLDAKRCARGNTVTHEEKRFLRGKVATDHKDSNVMKPGNCDISDLETLDCIICNDPLFLPVFQCKNGHTACPTCWGNLEKAKRGCHSCHETTWNIRCLVVEKILEHLSVRCSHAVYGCNEFLKFLKKKEHEEALCRYRPFTCPVDGCRYEGPKPALLQHFDKGHQMQAMQIDRTTRKVDFVMKWTEKYKLLQSDQELYIVYHEAMAGSEGDIFYCASLGPYKGNYVLKVELRSESRYHVLRTTVPEIKHLENWKCKRDHLVVPNGFQVDPRTNCLFDLEIGLYGGLVQLPA